VYTNTEPELSLRQVVKEYRGVKVTFSTLVAGGIRVKIEDDRAESPSNTFGTPTKAHVAAMLEIDNLLRPKFIS
jgi:hypothetical protein